MLRGCPLAMRNERTHAPACLLAAYLPAQPQFSRGGGEGGRERGGGRRERGAERGGEEVEWREGTCGSNDWRIPPPTPQLWPWMDGVGGGEKQRKKEMQILPPHLPSSCLPSLPGPENQRKAIERIRGKFLKTPPTNHLFFPGFKYTCNCNS